MASVFVSCSSKEISTGLKLCEVLESAGISCWMAARDLSPGTNWGEAIAKAIQGSRAHVLLLSSHSAESPQVLREVEFAAREGIPIFPVRIEDVRPAGRLEFRLSSLQLFDALQPPRDEAFRTVAGMIGRVLPPPAFPPPKQPCTPEGRKSRGYVFLSYVRDDRPFVERLIALFQERGYAYWDYVGGERDYHGALYHELEERIDSAVAFICVVSDSWRTSEWGASEYVYAKEAGIPIFVEQATRLQRPVPLLLNLRTRIDMSGDFQRAAGVLDQELKRKGL